jgi:4-amino-4-deoxy-L-arabinose transferase-like glycosyltransferase
MTASTKMRAHVTGAVIAAFVFRLYFVFRFPFYDAGDTPIDQELARNWLHRGIYGMYIYGHLLPVDMRTPGYPAFLAVIYALFGESSRAVMIAQAAVDTITCILAALIAALLAPRESRRKIALIALWLAALCPFTANYTAVVLTEALATFLTTLALLVLAEAILAARTSPIAVAISSQPQAMSLNMRWLLAGIVVGFGTLVRPETPLILIAAGLVLLGMWLRTRHWKRDLSKPLRAGTLMALGLLLPLLPWAARNGRTLHKVQFLSPRYSELPGEFTDHGFYAWTNTWLWRMRDVHLVSWNLDSDVINIGDVPASAFDSPAERQRVAALLAQYNETRRMNAKIDAGFAAIASERTARHPWRTYIEVPFLRALTIWFTSRVEMLPFSGHLWPIASAWNDDPVDFSVSLGLAILAILYAAMGLWGAWRCRANPAALLIVSYLLIRTAFLTTVETPEPRYVVECFPALLALAAQIWSRRSERGAAAPISLPVQAKAS